VSISTSWLIGFVQSILRRLVLLVRFLDLPLVHLLIHLLVRLLVHLLVHLLRRHHERQRLRQYLFLRLRLLFRLRRCRGLQPFIQPLFPRRLLLQFALQFLLQLLLQFLLQLALQFLLQFALLFLLQLALQFLVQLALQFLLQLPFQFPFQSQFPLQLPLKLPLVVRGGVQPLLCLRRLRRGRSRAQLFIRLLLLDRKLNSVILCLSLFTVPPTLNTLASQFRFDSAAQLREQLLIKSLPVVWLRLSSTMGSSSTTAAAIYCGKFASSKFASSSWGSTDGSPSLRSHLLEMPPASIAWVPPGQSHYPWGESCA
jgi:hypothetical protein